MFSIIASVMLGTVFLLGLGLAVGYRLGKEAGNARIVAVPSLQQTPRHPEYDCDVTDSIERHSRELISTAAKFRNSTPPELARAIDQLVVNTSRLQGVNLALPRISDEGKHLQPTQPSTAVADQLPRSVNPHMLSAQEMHAFTTLAGESGAEDSAKRRYPYDCSQQVYPFVGDQVAPDMSKGNSVRCHDISVNGISFFWPNDPKFEQLVISLGSESDPALMMAEVVQSKAVFMHGEMRTLVGCRFTGRYVERTVPRPGAAVQAMHSSRLSVAESLA